MPWESFRKKLSTDSSSGRKRRDSQQQQYQQPQRLAQHDQSQRSPPATQHPAFATVANQTIVARNQKQRAVSEQQPGQTAGSRASRSLAPEVYRKIKEVDQEPSTLTATGAKGLSTRILDRYDYSQPMPDGTVQIYSCQTIELYKRPGQSLGLYLREGDGEDRLDGIFVSRVQEGSDLRNSGVLFAGDEILSVNKVDVMQKNIDEVVVMISTPRHLLLRTRTMTKPRGEGARGVGVRDDLDGGKFIRPIDSIAPVVNRPVAVIKQLPRDESGESCMTDDGAPFASSQLMATAQTSLGVKARQQESTSSLSDTMMPFAGATSRAGMAPYRAASSIGTTAHQSRPRERNALAQRSLSDRWRYSRQFSTMQTSRADIAPQSFVAQGEEQGDEGNGDESNIGGGDVWRRAVDGGLRRQLTSSVPSAGYQSTLANTAYLPPPRLQSHLPTLERAAAMASGLDSNSTAAAAASLAASVGDMTNIALDPFQATPAVPSMWNPSMAAEFADPSVFSPRSAASDSRLAASAVQPPPRSVLRQPSAFPMSFFPPVKSNSLPRRHPPGRTIKWRNDVLVGGPEAAVVSPVAGYFPSAVEMSDSDGAVSAPELALSPGSIYVHNPTYPLPHTPTSGKTVDDVFSRNEYQAWARYPAQQPSMDRFRTPLTPGYGGYPEQRSYMQMSSRQQRPYSQLETGVGGYPDYTGMVQSTSALASGDTPTYWTRRRDEDQLYGGGQVPPPPVGYLLKTRSSSLPPRGALNQPGVDYDRRTYEDVSNLYGSDIGTLRGTGGVGYAGLDVSPLPRRRLPLSLAAANPSFGYATGMPLTSLESGATEGILTSLTGILFLRVIEGRQIRSRDPEEMYCVVEVDEEHRARTEVSDWQAAFHWNEMFEIDIWESKRVDFYIYSWHPRYRHKLRHRGFLLLVETLLSQSKSGLIDEMGLTWNGSQSSHSFALNLDPRGQLFIQVGFYAMAMAYRRQLATMRSSYWGVPLETLVEREANSVMGDGHVPAVLRRLIQEIERRGVDTTGLYVLCGSSSKKYLLRDQLQCDPSLADLSPDAVPDSNVLTSVLKDFLRELPEPLVPGCTFQMLLEAWKVCVPNDKEGNAKLMLGVVDCLTKINKCTFMVLMDHLKYVISQSPHNGLSATKCGLIFGPLVFCTSQAYPLMSRLSGSDQFCPPKPFFSFLDHRLAARLMEVLLELWPSPRSSSESSGSENSTVNLTDNGNTSLIDLWLRENQLPESNC